MSGAATQALPRWDLTTIYPGVDSAEYLASVDRLTSLIDELEALLTEAEGLDTDDPQAVTAAFDRLIAVFNDGLGLARHNRWFLQAHVAANSRDTAAQARKSELEALRARRAVAEARFLAWLGRIDVESLITASPAARDHDFLLRQAQTAARHLMDQPREALAAALQVSGGHAWSKLKSTLTTQMMVTIALPGGETVTKPLAETHIYSVDPDREVRRRAYESERDAWHTWREAFAAALNGVKGEHLTIARERGWSSILNESLFQNRMDRATLDAMLGACRRSLPDIRRYLRAKARALGIERLAWYDLWVPMPGSTPTWSWQDSIAFVIDQFDICSPDLGALARRAIDERWIDAEPRANKSFGLCMPLHGGDSRIPLNHIGTFDDVLVLAHELGHAYHNQCDAVVSPWRPESRPTILAESASTFCEILVARAAVDQSSESDRLAMLDATLRVAQASVAMCLGEFEFERAMIEQRAERELSAEEFSAISRETKRAIYGDALDPDALFDHGWAAFSHLYWIGRPFYNYPYTFGLLFGLGLYTTYQSEPTTFPKKFADLLASTGDADAATLTRRFGIDIQSSEFWESSLDVIRSDIDTFVSLVEREFPVPASGDAVPVRA